MDDVSSLASESRALPLQERRRSEAACSSTKPGQLLLSLSPANHHGRLVTRRVHSIIRDLFAGVHCGPRDPRTHHYASDPLG